MRADVVFSNVIPDPLTGYATICGVSLGCPQNGYTQGEPFTPAATYLLTDAQVMEGVNPFQGVPTFDVYIYSDNGGLPGALIEQIGFGLTAVSTTGSLITANSIATPVTLLAGSTYWLVVGPASADSWAPWLGAGASTEDLAFSGDGGATWADHGPWNSEFQIDGTRVVPEPSSFGLALPLLIGTFLFGRRFSWPQGKAAR